MSPDWTGCAAEGPEPGIKLASPIPTAPQRQPSPVKPMPFYCPGVPPISDAERARQTEDAVTRMYGSVEKYREYVARREQNYKCQHRHDFWREPLAELAKPALIWLCLIAAVVLLITFPYAVFLVIMYVYCFRDFCQNVRDYLKLK
jgi:hypothetical protein